MRRINFSVLTALIVLIPSILSASPAYPLPILFTQPNGNTIKITLKGDELLNRAESEDGYTLVSNSKGYYEYGSLDSRGYLIPSGIVAKNIAERDQNELAFLSKTKKKLTYNSDQRNMILQAKSVRSDYQKAFPTIGKRKLLCILIGFQDVNFTKTKADFENIFNQIGYAANGATGSVRDFYLENSNQQFDLSVTVAGSYIASNTMSYYGGNNSNNNDSNPYALAAEAINKADNDVDYSDFDNDGDGKVDGVYVIYAGYGEEAGGPKDAIWAHASSISPITHDGKTISRYSCSPELRSNSGSNITPIGVICHEFGHVLGAPDYYDTDYEKNGGEFNGTGKWDIMASGSWNNGGTTPANHNVYTKTSVYKWFPVTTLNSPSEINVSATNSSEANYYRINTTTPDEYFLIENRQNKGFDAALPGHGLMIYHMHSNFNTYVNYNNLNVGFPQLFYPICASNDIEPNSSPASFGQINSSGCAFPGSSQKKAFTDKTMPSSKSWAGESTNVPITNITENTTTGIVSFSLKENLQITASSNKVAIGEQVTFSAEYFGQANQWLWNFGSNSNPGSSSDFKPQAVTFSQAGIKTITLTGSGSSSITQSIEIEVYDPTTSPVAILSYNFEDMNAKADGGSPKNLSTIITCNTGNSSFTTGSSGPGSTSMFSDGWNDGVGSKAWTLQVNASGYKTLTVSSKQYSDASGPKDFKIQYKNGSSGSWVDAPNGSIAVASNFVSGIVSNLSLPSTCDNTQFELRWIMTSNNSVGGTAVSSTGKSKIDDIIITGIMDKSTGIDDNTEGTVTVFPNPVTSHVSIQSNVQLKLLSIFDITGRQILQLDGNENMTSINLTSLSKGNYIVRIIDINNALHVLKIIKE